MPGTPCDARQSFTTAVLSGSEVGEAPASRTATFTYDDDDLLIAYTDAGGGVSTFGYDDRGRVTSATDADGVTRGWAYDGNGNVTQATVGGDVVASYVYEDGERLVEVRSASGAVVASYAYNDWGGLVSWTDADGVGGALHYGQGSFEGQPISAAGGTHAHPTSLECTRRSNGCAPPRLRVRHRSGSVATATSGSTPAASPPSSIQA